jgi:hypothetical protein
MTDRESDDRLESDKTLEKGMRAVRVGHGGNCSSVGSVIDTLFVGAAAGGVVFAAILAAMKEEGVRVVGATADGTSDEGEDDERAAQKERP